MNACRRVEPAVEPGQCASWRVTSG